jgi:hypothetical protein
MDGVAEGEGDVYLGLYQLAGQPGKPVRYALGESPLDDQVSAVT